MNVEKPSRAEIIAKSVEKISDSKGLAEVGKGLGAGLVALAVAIAFVGMYFAITAGLKWDGHLHPQENCFKLQEVTGKIYKVNTCSGEAAPFEPKPNTEGK